MAKNGIHGKFARGKKILLTKRNIKAHLALVRNTLTSKPLRIMFCGQMSWNFLEDMGSVGTHVV